MSEYHVFDAFQDAVFIIGSNGEVYFGNEAAILLFEISARRLGSGKPLSDFIEFNPDPIDSSGALSQLQGATQVKEVQYKTSSGKEGWAQVSLQSQPEYFPSDQSDESRFIVLVRDVTLEKTLHDKYRAELDKKEQVIHDLQVAREKLEDYSRNLEKMVGERTTELREANQLLKTILDSLGQGILVFDSEGICLPIFSKICKTLFSIEPTGQKIERVLGLEKDAEESFSNWRKVVFDEMLEFDELVPLAPSELANQSERSVALDYNPMLDADGNLRGVVMVATDKTREVEAIRKAENEQSLVRKIVQVARHKDSFRLFITDAEQVLKEMTSPQTLDFESIARKLHTLKGGAATFALMEIAKRCHGLEDILKDTPEQGGPQREAFMQRLAGEAQVLRDMLSEEVQSVSALLGPIVSGHDRSIELSFEQVSRWAEALLNVSSEARVAQTATQIVARQVAKEITSACLEKPIGESVRRFESSLQSAAESLGRQVAPLEIIGGELPVAMGPIQDLMASLIHAYRNAVDHGIESAIEREQSGKAPQGRILTHFSEFDRGGVSWLEIRISDDGRGIDPSRIRQKLQRLGQSHLAVQSDSDVIQAVLRDDFSTAERVTELSGRGVGLSAVAAEVKRLGGEAKVSSKVGEGMTLTIHIPKPVAQLPCVSAIRKSA